MRTLKIHNFVLIIACSVACCSSIPFAANLVFAEAAESIAVKGKIQVSNRGKTSTLESLIYLTPLDKKAVPAAAAKTHSIKMRKKMFSPQILSIVRGDTVIFPNDDPFTHSIYSLSQGGFDLGSYRKNAGRSQQFNRVGVYKIFCNVHASMSAFILVSPSKWHGISNKQGEFSIPNVPAGRYKIFAWNNLGELEQEIRVDNSGENFLALTVVRRDRSKESDNQKPESADSDDDSDDEEY